MRIASALTTALCTALLAGIVVGCQYEQAPPVSGKLTDLSLTLEPAITKTDLTYNAEDNKLKCSWALTDKVWVSDLVSSARFAIPEDVSVASTTDFQGTLNVSSSASSIYAVYPFEAATLASGTAVVTLPAAQGADNPGQYDLKAGATALPDGNTYTSLSIPLKNLLSILKVKLKIPATLGGYDFSNEELLSLSLNSNLPVTGQAALQLTGDDITAGNFTANALTYSFPAGTSATTAQDLLLFIAPGNYTSESIVWTAETTSSSIHFKLSPGMDLQAGYFYKATFNLGSSAWNLVNTAPSSERDCFIEAAPDPIILKTAVTPTSGSIAWSEPATQTYRKYNIQLLADASASTILREYLVKIKAGDKAAFTFGGLDPERIYYARVQGAQGRGMNTNWSQAVAFTTDPSVAYDAETTVASADFDLCPWGGDYMHLAIATRPQTDAQSSLSAGWSNCYSNIIIDTPASYTGFTRLAGAFDPDYASMLSELGLDGWTFNNVYMRPGYAQVGNGAAASLTSPALSDLPTGSPHTVNVSFKAVPYTASGSKSGSVTVTCTSGGGTTVGTQTVSLSATPVIPDALPSWQECSVTFGNVPAGSRISFSNGGASNDFCIDEIVITSDDALPHIDHTEGNVYGLVADTDGNPLAGVVVSDGYVVTTTNAKGVYQFTSQKANGYVFISQPQGYEVMLDGVFPQFWQALDSDPALEERHDFRLTPVDNSDCVLLALGDFHLCNRNALYDLRQFRMEAGELISTVQGLQAQGKKVYGLTLGDMTWDIYWDKSSGLAGCNFDLAAYRNEVNNDFAGLDFPLWHTIGNHDHDYRATGDWDTVIPYKQILGPTYYSFNVAGYHVVVLDNVISENDGTSGGRGDSAGLTSDILSWLQADMAQVPAGTPVIVSMHEQAYRPTNPFGGSKPETYASSLESVLSGRNIHIVTGHTHNINNVKRSNIYEHNAGALCATWWWTGRFCITNEATWGGGTSLADTYHIGRDGSPAGYTIYNLSSGTMNWQYKAFGLPASRQLKTYDRNQFALTAANWCPTASSSNQSAFEALAAKQPDYSYTSEAGSDKVPSNLVYINVWNWDPDWTITVKEGSSNLTVTKLQNAYDPMHMVAYPATRYNSGNGTTSTFVTCPTQHIFRVQASSATSTLTITVRDRFGNTYTETMTRPKTFSVNWD